jgi:cadherin 23
VKGDVAGNFSVDSVSGELRPNGLIDYELIEPSGGDGADDETRTFELILRAHDLGNPPLHSDVTVTVFVTDKNDHTPVFESSHYRVAIDEDAVGGTEIISVRAHDGDGSAPNNEIVYRLRSGAKDKFVIDSETGVISVSQGANLDPDQTVPKSYSYLVEVVAIDGGLGSAKLTGSATVNVTVRDVNNKPPYFDYPVSSLSILENINPGSFISVVTARDPDRTASLRYFIDSAASKALSEDGRIVSSRIFSVDETFQLDPNNGDLRAVGTIDREIVATIKLVVVVKDAGSDTGEQFATAVLEIVVKDQNDNNPLFRKSLYKASIPENSPKGTRILSVQATDADQNRTVSYSLEGTDRIVQLLQIDTENGDIAVAEKIDRERVAWLNFTVRATDSGFPPRSNFVDVSVAVIDENDNAPLFVDRNNAAATNITVPEDVAPGTTIARLVATDADSGEFGKVTYFLDRRSASLGKFRLDPATGELFVLGRLNREEEDAYVLIVEAYDNHQFGFSIGESRRSFAQVQITVADVNDESPVFEAADDGAAGCALVTEFHEVREPVLVVRASDADDPRTANGKMDFKIVSGNDLGLFRVESEAGGSTSSAKVFPRKPLKGYYGNYSLTLQASDRGSPPNVARAKFAVCVQVRRSLCKSFNLM